MHTAYYNEYSYHLDRMMGSRFTVMPDGLAGVPGAERRFYDFENFGMVGAVQDLLEQGRLQLFTATASTGRPGPLSTANAAAGSSVTRPMPATSWKNWRRGSSRLTSGPTTAGGPADSDDRLQSGGASRREFHVPLAGSVQRHDRLKRHLFQQVVFRQLHGRSGL